jgi:hypothetical protein
MANKHKRLLLLWGALIVAVASCRPEEVAPPDCTTGLKPSSNPIEFYLEARRGEPFAYEDTMCGSPYVFFNSKTTYESYEWRVGTDPRVWTARRFELQFQNYVGTVDIRLIGRRKARPECQSGDVGIDTFTRRLTILPRLDVPIFGRYNGTILEEPGAPFFEIKVGDDFNLGYIQNMPNGCLYDVEPPDFLVPTTWIYAFRIKLPAIVASGTPCWYGDGDAELLADRRTIVVRYKWNPDGLGIRTRTFRGVRLP